MRVMIDLTADSTDYVDEHELIWPFHFLPRIGEFIELAAFLTDEIHPEFRGLYFRVVDIEWNTTPVICCYGTNILKT